MKTEMSEIEKKYPQALTFLKTPKHTNFKIGQIIVIPKKNEAYILDIDKSWQLI